MSFAFFQQLATGDRGRRTGVRMRPQSRFESPGELTAGRQRAEPPELSSAIPPSSDEEMTAHPSLTPPLPSQSSPQVAAPPPVRRPAEPRTRRQSSQVGVSAVTESLSPAPDADIQAAEIPLREGGRVAPDSSTIVPPTLQHPQKLVAPQPIRSPQPQRSRVAVTDKGEIENVHPPHHPPEKREQPSIAAPAGRPVTARASRKRGPSPTDTGNLSPSPVHDIHRRPPFSTAAKEAAASRHPGANTPPAIEISIGRIVLQPDAPAPIPQQKRRSFQPQVKLDAYLQKRNGGTG